MEEKNYSINNHLFDSYLERMNFLNEISIDYPDAISFGSGRPNKHFFNVKDIVSHFLSFAGRNHEGSGNGEDFFNALGQYNKTKGIINESISSLLLNDEKIDAASGDIIITDGAQEGMVIVINTLIDLNSNNDVLLVSDLSYIGFVGYAKIAGVPIISVPRDENSIHLECLEDTIVQLKKKGKIPKVVYEVPDFHNPTGEYMPLEKRKHLIELAEKHNLFIVEDNPYGYFRYDGEKIPTLKALDTYCRVIYLGSFSKTLFPSIRMGYLVAGQQVTDPRNKNKTTPLVEALKKTKSFTTVNTSTLLQAMVGHFLQSQDYTLIPFCQPKVAAYKENRDAMLRALSKHFPSSPRVILSFTGFTICNN
jgi:(S)-3,5-dihydroxyphenylglycine transaminase